MPEFDFGKNWEEYSNNALDETSLKEAENSLAELLGPDGLSGKSFLDVGSGSGIFSIAAARNGSTKIIGLDVNPKCIEVAVKNAQVYLKGSTKPEFVLLSVLNNDGINELGKFSIVYAWGSLQFTGAMYKAIENTAGCVEDGGTFVLAVYNKHFTSPIWKIIKKIYNISPELIKRFMVYFFSVLIYIAKYIVTGSNPLKQRRGMNFFYNVIDWLGGYPYEYASVDEIKTFVGKLGFETVKMIPPDVPTGCNEFILKKNTV
jgi:SAM-dependent methyltransferase